LFNAIFVQIALGVPMLLYMKLLGASTTVLGIVAALAPLFTIVLLFSHFFVSDF